VARNINVTGNSGNGLDVDDSSVTINGSSIAGNANPDVTAAFGARLTIDNTSMIGPVFCADNQGVLSRRIPSGPPVCPTP
jgi:hypothetical protein